MSAPERFSVTCYLRHPRATPEYLVHDSEEGPGQIAVFTDQALARAFVLLAGSDPKAWDAAIKAADPNRGAF